MRAGGQPAYLTKEIKHNMAIDKKHIKAVIIALTATYLASMFTACDQAVKPSETTSATTATGTA